MKYTEERTSRAAEEVEKNAGNNTVIVGMKMGSASRELLTWALVKVAHTGDRVIALHVIPSVHEVADSFENPSFLISLVDAFDDVLNDYEGFCKLKQIDLKLKLCRGTSIRRVLVQEVISVSASKLVLGASRNNRVVGSSSSCIAKYCTKKVSPGCLVLAVNNGRVVFKKESTGRQNLHKSDSMKLQKFNAQAWKNAILPKPSDDAICDSLRDFVITENDKNSLEDGTKRPPSVLPKKEIESSFGCVSMLTRELPVARPGWSLLRRAVLTRIKGFKNDLGWAERYKIAVGVAEALNYLHNSSETQCVIHRDVKSSNILLSDDFEPQLSDFGLARLASSSLQSDDGIMDCSNLAGTVGYLAPEYFMYGKIDEKIDVYAFGVVLLELISGKRPVSTGCPKGEESLTSWAKPILHDSKFEQLVDPCLGDNYNIDEMERLSLSAALCIRKANNSRPSASLVRSKHVFYKPSLILLLGDEFRAYKLVKPCL
ncbi:hypothetical protein HPP92_011388 [Vanilla planifolia]|uniref:Protein kinase domain-containing protein n=1 Tax=Vanilla planifolia TaxID=51239 RepID=A0A835QVL0_VANPL|nr:hypothetical protein HPP92_011388 [Vanilla planifolia]